METVRYDGAVMLLADWLQVEVKKAEPRDLRQIADCAATTGTAFIVAPSFLPGPMTALPNTGLLAGSWCSPNGSGMSYV